jgi:FMN phosphatase YigB (HAD superfamily)
MSNHLSALICDFANVILLPRSDAPQTFLGNLYAQLEDPRAQLDRNFVFNYQLLDFFTQHKNHLTLAIYSNSAGLLKDKYIKQVVSPVFEHVLLSKELGLAKDNPAGYTTICQQLNVAPSNTVFIDDNLFNVEAARNAGLHGIHFTSTDQTITELQLLV